MSAAVERHLDKAFAALDDVSVRELEATAAVLMRRKDCLGDFYSVFSGVAAARLGGWLARFHLGQAVSSRQAEDLVEWIAEAPAPFWAHVRDALAERHP